MGVDLLSSRLAGLGLGGVASVERAVGGFAAESALIRLQSGREVFAKTLAEPPSDDVFGVEAEGLAALRGAGLATAEVLAVGRDVLVLDRLLPRRDEAGA